MPVKLGLLVFVSLGYCVRYFFEFIFMVNNEDEFVRQLTHAISALHKVDRVFSYIVIKSPVLKDGVPLRRLLRH
ncbi:hypothetical protein UG46_15230 [Pseudomonas fluorescens]|nr:hypothetical protein UG46_15230 [Pseudomonas fluorescens]